MQPSALPSRESLPCHAVRAAHHRHHDRRRRWRQVLTLFALHESIVLAKHEIDYRGYGMALVNAWVLAKVMLVADDLNLGSRWFENRRCAYCSSLDRTSSPGT